MNSLVAKKQDSVRELCRRFRVRRLELFGSATGSSFNENSSDLDFVVEFEEFRSEGSDYELSHSAKRTQRLAVV